MANLLTAIGLMSGTSMDGIDVALIKTDGINQIETGPAMSFPFDEEMRDKLVAAMAEATEITQPDQRPGNLAKFESQITDTHARAVESFLQQNRLTDSDIDIIGFHGQTVLHRPNIGLTVQLGDGQRMANRLNIDVVHDLRSADVKAGGQGAPLVPVYHQALASQIKTRPLAFINIGGISNITFLGEQNQLIAFDCGPGNALLDDWTFEHTGKSYDKDGKLARSGNLNDEVLHEYLLNPYYARRVPKSLDRGDFTLKQVKSLTPADGARTLVELTARSIARAGEWLPDQPLEWIICGGGRHNKFLMQRIAANVQGIVTPAEAHHLDGDALEAQAFAYLAVRSLEALPLTYPQTTGVENPTTGGVLNRAKVDPRIIF